MTWRHRKVLGAILDRVAEPGDAVEAIFAYDETRRWPVDAVNQLVRSHLLREAQPADVITCTGCEERCRRPVTVYSAAKGRAAGATSTCHLFTDKGPFEHPQERLKRWVARRKWIAKFVARSIGLSIRDFDERWRRIRFYTLEVGEHPRALILEFNGTASLTVGSTNISLIECVDWTDSGIAMDDEALAVLTANSADVQSGGKRFQPSTTIREDNKALTEIRNRRLQRRMIELARKHPKLSKYGLAKLIEKSGEIDGMNSSTIARLTRMPKKK